MRWLTWRRAVRWGLIGQALLVLLSALALWSWGEFASRAQGEPSHALPTQPAVTPLDRVVGPLTQRNAGHSAAALVTDNVQAFTLRAQAARGARAMSSYALTLDDAGALRWQGAPDATGQPSTWSRDPEASAPLRALVWLLSWLPIESQW